MKRLSLLAVCLLCFAALAAVANAQPGGAQSGPSRIGFIDSAAFGAEKEGITRFVNGEKQLDTEFKPRVADLQTMQTRIQALADEIAKLQATPANVPAADVQKQIAAKNDEGQRLQTDFKRKQEDLQAAYKKREDEVLGPINNDIMKSLQEFSIQKGFTAIFDIGKLADSGGILALDPKADLTKDFVTYYNAKTAGTASTAVPK